MQCLTKITFVMSVIFVLHVSGNLIRSDVVTTKDVPVPKVEENEIEANLNVPVPVEEVAVDEVAIDEVAGDDKTKPCTEVGQFCVNHSDCCSNACLGYMRRCVSG